MFRHPFNPFQNHVQKSKWTKSETYLTFFNEKTTVLEYLRLSDMKRNLVEATASWHNLFFFVLSKDFITGRDHFFKWDLITCRCGPFLVSTKNHQRIQAPNFEGFLNLRRLFRRWGFPYIGRIHTAYIAEYLHFGYLKCLLKHLFFGDLPRFATFGWFFTWWRCSGERPFFRVRSRGTLLGVCELWIVGAK